jgi:ketosteroid isomerase-like protein
MIWLLLATATATVSAQDAADHEALRALKGGLVQAINKRDMGALETIVHKPFMVTVITQDSFTDVAGMKAYYDSLFTRKLLRLANVTISAEADELSQIYTGTFAVARGSTQEVYALADGRRFTMPGRWTAVALKEGDQWKLLAVHDGTNFLENPVLGAIEKSTSYLAAGSLGGGLAAGLLVGFLLGRRRGKA